ncbi:tyrosine-type recombinase/integrase [Treponema vincentii]|uniref:Tyrosine-type recombinase/integrase n=1 Tax=Treponema vincentii TaxID=69710 RepID=A0A6P1Y0A8_9SPIR|nr:tyrosine-type recombinase/integrase [Treponema vincentii]
MLQEAGYDICIVQKLLDHSDVSTTMVYTLVLNRGGLAVPSPMTGCDFYLNLVKMT